MAVRLENKMSARSLPKDMVMRRAVLSASFDNKQRAQTMNARENLRLEKQQRDFDLFKNNVEKEFSLLGSTPSQLDFLSHGTVCPLQFSETFLQVFVSDFRLGPRLPRFLA